MDAVSYSQVRQKLARTMDKVCRDREAVIITRQRSESVVMMSLEEYEALEETAFLLRSPKNAKRLIAAMSELEAGRGAVRELAE